MEVQHEGSSPKSAEQKPSGSGNFVIIVLLILMLLAKWFGGDKAATSARAGEEKQSDSVEKMRRIMEDDAYHKHLVDAYSQRRW